MIRCPTCGTLNDESRRTCIKCGNRLPQTKIRCPNCGALNPVGNAFCDKCNTRLLDAEETIPPPASSRDRDEEAPPAVKGISLPTRSASDRDEAPTPSDVPDWLLDLQEEAGGSLSSDEGPAEPSTDEEDYPDWLSELVDEAGSLVDDAAQQPSGADADLETSAGAGASAEDEHVDEFPDFDLGAAIGGDELPDWLDELGTGHERSDAGVQSSPAESPPEGQPEQSQESEASYGASDDWLSEIEFADVGETETPSSADLDLGVGPLAEDEMPDWLRFDDDDEETTEEVPGAHEPAFSEEESRDEASYEGAFSEDAGSMEALPDWLSTLAVASETTPEAGQGELPDWLRTDEEPAEAEPSSPDQGLPDWLLDTGTGAREDEEEGAPPPVPEPEPTQAPEPEIALDFSESELPDWLADAQDLGNLGDLEEASTGEAAGLEEAEVADEDEDRPEDVTSQPEEATPSAAQAGEERPTPAAQPSELTSDELPDWLSEIPEAEASSEYVSPEYVSPEYVSREYVSREGAAFDEDELPDWLRDLGPEEVTEEPAEPETTADELRADSAEAEALPDWLSDLGPAASTPEGESVVSTDEAQAPEEEVPETPDLAPAELPAWLQEVASSEDLPQEISGTPASVGETAAGETETSEEISPAAPSEEPTPSWVEEIDVSASQEEAEQPAGADDEEVLARAELPDWLKALAPSQTRSPEEDEGVRATPEGLVLADIPDWVQALRPEPRAEGEVPQRRGPLTPPEPEGPLEGLPGVLPSMVTVDMPEDAMPTVEREIPHDVVEQAHLWQQLLEQPRGVRRPVTQERAQRVAAAGVIRVIVAAILVLGVAAALVLLPNLASQGLVFDFSQVPSVDVARGVPILVDRVDQLQAGDRVILAFEYGPAYADEMARIAKPVLEHLAERDAEPVIVSTLPGGVGLGASLWAQASDSPAMDTGEYLVGNLNGIAEFMARPDTQASRHVFVFSSSSERTRWWIEQRAVLGQDSTGDRLPISIGASAATGSLITPYLNNRNVEGWIVGFPQALTYRDVRGTLVEGEGLALDVLMLVHWAAAGLITIGFLYYLVAGRKGTR
ncbi:MAG: double zinc ribbon domain-containing protein [Anaerolineae bacterium]